MSGVPLPQLRMTHANSERVSSERHAYALLSTITQHE